MSQQLKEKSEDFAVSDNWRSIFELIVTVIGYAVSIYVLYTAFTVHMWPVYITFFVIAGFFMVKLFTLFHDCTHESMFTSIAANVWVGRFLSLIITMPFASWKAEHDDHHDHVVDMEKMDFGDIPLLTVEEFKNKSKLRQLGYSIFRQPLFFLFVAPFLYFFVRARLPGMMTKKAVWSVITTNIVVAAIYIPLLLHFGFWVMVFVFAAPAYLSGVIGLALFYLQHNYPDSHWYKTEDWEFETAAIDGSSLIILPQPLEWFSHAIGYHHIHHLNSKVPGYRLRECYDAVKEFREIEPLSWQDALDAFKLRLWSYEKNKLVTLKESLGLST